MIGPKHHIAGTASKNAAVTGMVCCILLFSLLTRAEERITLSLWAAQATQEGKTPKEFEPGLEPIANAVADLPFDSYRKLLAEKRAIAYKKETPIPVESRYTLFVTPLSKESDGRLRMDIRVELAPKTAGGTPVAVLSTRLMASPGKLVKLGGFALEKGELIIVFSAIP